MLRISSLLAGRYKYNGTADPAAEPTNYVAPLRVFRLVFDEPYSYSFYITAGTAGEIRETFTEINSAQPGESTLPASQTDN